MYQVMTHSNKMWEIIILVRLQEEHLKYFKISFHFSDKCKLKKLRQKSGVHNFICRVPPPTHLSRQRAPLRSQIPKLAAGHHLLVAIVYVGNGHIPVKVTSIHSTAVPAAVHKLTGVELPDSWGQHAGVVSV